MSKNSPQVEIEEVDDDNNNINNDANESNNDANDNSYVQYWDTKAEVPQKVKFQPTNVQPRVYHDVRDYLNPYFDKPQDYDVVKNIKPKLGKKKATFTQPEAYDSLARKVERTKLSYKRPKEDYIQNVIKLVGSKANKDITRNNELVSVNGANMWLEKHHPDQGWYIEEQDEDGDGIPEVSVMQPDRSTYSINGYVIKKSDMGSRQPYYNAFPTKAERKQARENGITMSNFGALRFGPKPLDINDPFNVQYQKNPYDDPMYLKQLITHRAPHVPQTRTPYQVFTGLISKSIWENFKQWLSNKENTYMTYMENIGTESEPKWEFVNHKEAKKYLAAEDMISYSAYAYEKEVKNEVFKIFDKPEIYQKAFGKLQLKLANARAKVEVNPSEKNKQSLAKILKIFNNETDLSNEIVKVITNSEAFKEACENRVKQIISPENRPIILNKLFAKLVEAQIFNEKTLQEEEQSKGQGKADLTNLIKFETIQQKLKKQIIHSNMRPVLFQD